MNIRSHSLRNKVTAWIQYNYFTQNGFLRDMEEYVDMWPRSFTIGIFGSQLANIHFNRLWNILFDFELISGAKVKLCSFAYDEVIFLRLVYFNFFFTYLLFIFIPKISIFTVLIFIFQFLIMKI